MKFLRDYVEVVLNLFKVAERVDFVFESGIKFS